MALVYFKEKGAENIVAVWKIEESEDELLKMLPVNDEIKSKLKDFNHQKRRLEWLSSRVLLYKFTGFIPIIEYNENGQPYIPGLNKNISISHTEGYAAVAISDSLPAGIDIEIPKERILRVVERFVHPSENNYIPVGKEINYYTLIWCAKETLFKMINRTGIIFNEELQIMPFVIENEGVLKVAVTTESKSEYFLSYIITPQFHLVWYN